MQWAAVRMTYSLRMVPPQKPWLSSFRRRACRDGTENTRRKALMWEDEARWFNYTDYNCQCLSDRKTVILRRLFGASTCQGHSPGGQSSPLTMRVIPLLWEKMICSTTKSCGGIWLLVSIVGERPSALGSSSCLVEFAFVIGSVAFPPVTFPRSYLKTVRTFSVSMAPHLKVSVKVQEKLGGQLVFWMLNCDKMMFIF